MDTNQKPISEVMSRTVCEIRADCSVGQALSLMHEQSVSSVLVVEDELILGIVTERDIVRALHRSGRVRELGCTDLMQSPVVSVEATTSCLEVYHLMAGRGFRHIAITDERGHLVGIASEGDILRDFGIEYFMRFKDVGSVMTTEVCTLPKLATVGEAVALMDERRQSCVIAVDNLGRPVGILTERDVVRLCHAQEHPERMLLGQAMRGPVRTAGAADLLHEAVRAMAAAGIRRLVVVDAGNRVCGLVTHHEIVRGLEGHYVTYLRDIVRRQENDLKSGQTVFRDKLLLDNILRSAIGTAVIATDREGRIAFCNPTVEPVLELDPATLPGADLRELLTRRGCHEIIALLAEDRLGDGLPHPVSCAWSGRSGTVRTEVQVSMLIDESAQPQGFLLLAQDGS